MVRAIEEWMGMKPGAPKVQRRMCLLGGTLGLNITSALQKVVTRTAAMY